MDTNTNQPRRIGRIYATIAGDYRYATTIEVWTTGPGIEIRLLSTNPVGGMDGGTDETHQSHQVLASWVNAALVTPAVLIKALKKTFATADAGTVARYGKPTKNFTWYTADGAVQGLSAALAKRAMEAG